MAVKITTTKIDQLIPDDLNANKHTEFGTHLLEKSISSFGLGRSILIDKNNRIIAGNGVAETAGQLGLDNVIIIETDGKKLIAVKRTDLDLDDQEARELAIADNASAKANIAWDEANVKQIKEGWSIDTEAWGIPKFEEPGPIQPPEKQKISTTLLVECKNAAMLEALFSELQDRGFECKLK